MISTLGLDIGGTCVKVAMVSEADVIGVSESDHYSRPSFDELVEIIRGVLAAVPGDAEPVACGLCLPGRVREDGEVEQSVNLPGLVGRRAGDLLSEAIGSEVQSRRLTLVPDVQAAAYGWWVEAGRPEGRLLAVALGTGSGACVLDDGTPLRVSGRSSGHFGQLDVSLSEDAPIGPDGGRGSLEGYIGIPALRDRFGPDIDEGVRKMSADDEPVRALVRAMRIGHAMYRPDHIALLGGVGVLLAGIRDDIDARVRDGLTGVARPDWTLAVGTDAFHGARGAAWMAMVAAGHIGCR